MKKCLIFMVCVSVVISVGLITFKAMAQEGSGTATVDASIQAKLEELKKI